MKIELGALSDSIEDQLEEQGFKQVGLPVDVLDRVANGLTMAHLHGCLTDSEVDRGRKRLVKLIKVQPNTELRRVA